MRCKGELVITKAFKSSKFLELERRGIANLESIEKIANEGISYMKGYKSKSRGEEDKALAKFIIQQSKKGWSK